MRLQNVRRYGVPYICDDLWLCSVKYSACVSGFWGLLDPTPSFAPPRLSKFLATPLVVVIVLLFVFAIIVIIDVHIS